MPSTRFSPGDILFLERPVEGIDYQTGFFVLRAVVEDHAFVSLVSQNRHGLYPIDSICMIATADLAAFTATGERANLKA